MISFIIPAFNEEKRIEKILQSLSNYRGPCEIIVSDDNSTDATVAVARKYTDKIIINPGKKRGIAANRNRGAKIAQDGYLVFIDADICINDPDVFFKKAEGLFQKDRRIVALTVFLRVFKDVETLSDKIILEIGNYLFLVLNNFLGIGAASGEFQMIRADAFRRVGGFNENLITGEDQDMFRRLAKVGKTYSEKTLIAYHDGRRAHAIGWPKLFWLWTRDTISVLIFKKSQSRIWTDIR